MNESPKLGGMSLWKITITLGGPGQEQSQLTANVYAHNQPAAIALALFGARLVDADSLDTDPRCPLHAHLQVNCEPWKPPN